MTFASLRTIAVVVGFALQVAGCAFGTRFVELTYPPDKTTNFSFDQQLHQASMRTRTIVLSVHDRREKIERIGNIRNGFGQDTASIVTDGNVALWVHDAIAYELGSLGYEVIDAEDGPSDGSFDRLTTNVRKVYCDIYAVYDGEVTLEGSIRSADSEVQDGEFPVKVKSGLSYAGTAKATGESLAQALQESIRNMLVEFGFLEIPSS